ncbi:MAG: hypothetical protein M3Z36_14255 [Acidobacteriota bacterium]|nr:hypothetical protein [Acidobacteriota bacterium]
MNLKTFATSAGVFIAAVAAGNANAQGPLYDKVIVDLPYSVSINETTLQPGHYVIRQFDSPGGGSRILQIFSDNGMKLKTTAMTIPALDNNTPSKTSVILHHYGNDYYFDKVWIQGKNYGYEFPLPAAVKSRQRERMEPYTVAASYQPTSSATDDSSSSTSSSSSSVSSSTTNTTQNTPAPAASRSSSTTTDRDQTTIAQNRPPASTTDTASSSSTVSDQSGSSDTSRSRTRRMPKTGGDWFTMLLSGGMLSGAGLLLRRSVRSL